MFDYIVASPFNMQTTDGTKLIARGEALSLSSIKVAPVVNNGFLIEKNVSGLLDIQSACETRISILMEKLQLDIATAKTRANALAASLIARHDSLKSFSHPSTEFLAEVAEFNRITKGYNKPITIIDSDTGAGEWAGYNCNIGTGCSHGCLYCYAEKMAKRFNRVENYEAWLIESLRESSTAKCKKYPNWVMFPTTHDITPAYLPAYCCHLYNILKVGNKVVLVTKPHRLSIEAICSEFSSFRDNMIIRFTIGGLDNDALRVWEPGAPSLQERLWCLKYAFEKGFRTSISCEPMLVSCEEAERMYYSLEPLVTENIWFGKMNNVGSFTKHSDSEIAIRAAALKNSYKDDSIIQFVGKMTDLPKVEWKDSVKAVINKYAGDESL
jgi:DNA repair photolyase